MSSERQPLILARRYLLTSERTIERIRMIENVIRKIRSHFVLLGSLALFFRFRSAISCTYLVFGESFFERSFELLQCNRLGDVGVGAVADRLVHHRIGRLRG